GLAHDFRQTRTRSGNMRQRVFFAGVSRDVVFAGTGGVDELDLDVFAHAVQVAITPQLPGISCCRTAALFRRTAVRAAGGMRLNLIRRTPDDIDVAPVGFPSGYSGGEVFVGVGEAAVVLLPDRVDG